MRTGITRELLAEVRQLTASKNQLALRKFAENMHPADAADLVAELELPESTSLMMLSAEEYAAEVLAEMEDPEELLRSFTPGQIARRIAELDTDDAADVMQSLPSSMQDEVMSRISDKRHAEEIEGLLHFEDDTAGGMMRTELLRVYDNWDVGICIKEIRRQAEELDEIYDAYVLDNEDRLLGVLPLKKILQNHEKVKVRIYDADIARVNLAMKSEDVANLMDKYGMIAMPVVDERGCLKGIISIDDIVDVIREEAERDIKNLAGLVDVAHDEGVLGQARARLPWLVLGMIGGICGSVILSGYQNDLQAYTGLALFLPLIGGTAGNVGVQSWAIVVQSIASGEVDLAAPFSKLMKELGVGLLIGASCSGLVFAYNIFVNHSTTLALAVSSALMAVIVLASLMGTAIPLLLKKIGIDPALATGPFITTTNDIVGLITYLGIARLLFGVLGN